KLALDLPAQAPDGRSTNAEAIARFQERVPRAGAEYGWRVADTRRLRVCPQTGSCADLIVVEIASDREFAGAPELLIEGAAFRFGMTRLKAGRGTGQLKFVAPMQALATAAAGNDLVLTLIEGERAGTFTVAAPR